MAAVAFDPLEYTHQLEAQDVPREQAEVHAKAMTAVFLHNFDALVTKDYLDSRFNELETRMEAKIDRRFVQIDQRFTAVDVRLARINVLLGVILVAVAIPLLQTVLIWLG